jgi:hypothetical protein
MSWARLDDAMLDNAKVIMAGPLGFALHVAAITWCARNLTDGRIPKARAHMLFPGDWESTALHLCVCNLWHENGNCYLLHDFLRYNFSRKQILNRRLRTNERVKRHRNAVTNAAVTGHPVSVFSSPDLLPGISGASEARLTVARRKRAPRASSPLVSWPDDFKLTDERREVARAFGLDPATEWNNFKDSALAHARKYADWNAAWRKWCRSAENFARREHGTR